MADAQLQTFEIVGKVEKVDDVITMLTPSKTPFLSGISTGSTDREKFNWLEDNLRKSKRNAAKEGATFAPTARTPAIKRENVCHIFTDTFEVSGTADAINIHGVKGTMTAREMMKAGKALKLDVENQYVSDRAFVDAADEAGTRETGGVGSMISAANTVDAAAGALSEELIMDASEAAALSGGTDIDTLMIRLADAKIVAGFAGLAERTREVGNDAARKFVNTLDVYVTPFHELRIVKNIEMNDYANAYGLDMSTWSDEVLRGWERTLLAKVKDANTHSLLTERGLKGTNSNANFRIKNLTPVA